MDGPRRSGDAFTLQSLYIAAGVTFLCCLFALWSSLHRFLMAPRKGMAVESVRSSKKQCGCSCSCGGGFGGEGYSGSAAGHANGEVVAGEKGRAGAAEGERQVGASMMEQLVPEITTHALSYLDYPSLCRLSMTNSSMRRAANDDNAWKALYHKDFAVEQDGITPVNGWKAYYAATKAVVDVNAEFYNIIKNRSLLAMSRLWLHADYVKCVHGSGELFSGYTSVMDSWELALNWGQGGQGVAFEIRDVRARVQGEMAWVIMKAYVDMESGPSNVTNVFEFHDGRWYMVHHHSSVMLVDGDAGHHHGFV